MAFSSFMFCNKQMLYVVVAALLLAGNGATAANRYRFNQGKLPEGAKMIEAMCEVQVAARELVIQSASWRHTVVVFVYPIGSKHLWIWDPDSKSLDTDKDPEDPMVIAKAWVAAMAPGEVVSQAFFLPAGQCIETP